MPQFEIGLIADVQYADLDDGTTEGRTQRFREAPAKLNAALADLSAHRSPSDRRLELVLHLGDIINGGATAEATQAELQLISSMFDEQLAGKIPAVHVIGNHCLAAGRAPLMTQLRMPELGYFTVQLPHKWRLVVLDTTEISGHSGFPEGSGQWAEARAFEAAHPLSEENPQMACWNGGVSERQLEWLRQALGAAEAAGERVIVACHHQFGMGAVRATHMAWNWRALQEACLASPAFRLALAGHDHLGGYASFGGNRHFVTLEALLEAPSGSNAYAVLAVSVDVVEIQGRGSVTSRKLCVT